MVTAVPNTLPLPPPPSVGMFVHTPCAAERVYLRLVMLGCATAPLPYTASIASESSGANVRTLHCCNIVLSITAVVHGGEVPVFPVGLTLLPNPFVQAAAVSAFVERPTE